MTLFSIVWGTAIEKPQPAVLLTYTAALRLFRHKEISFLMIRVAASLFLGAAIAFSQDHQTMVNEHGDHVMGFSHEKTTHHFELHYDGGVIDVRADDVKDT